MKLKASGNAMTAKITINAGARRTVIKKRSLALSLKYLLATDEHFYTRRTNQATTNIALLRDQFAHCILSFVSDFDIRASDFMLARFNPESVRGCPTASASTLLTVQRLI